MANNWQDFSQEWENDVPKELEDRILHQARTMSLFGQVVELFVPDALQAVVHIIGGSKSDVSQGPRTPDEPLPEWRIPPEWRKR